MASRASENLLLLAVRMNLSGPNTRHWCFGVLFYGKPGSGPGPHRLLRRVQFIPRRERGRSTADLRGGAGDLCHQAGEIHKLQGVGDSPLVQVDIHLSPASSREPIVAPIRYQSRPLRIVLRGVQRFHLEHTAHDL